MAQTTGKNGNIEVGGVIFDASDMIVSDPKPSTREGVVIGFRLSVEMSFKMPDEATKTVRQHGRITEYLN